LKRLFIDIFLTLRLSDFLFETAVVIDTSTKMVMDHLQELFIKYGWPYIIKAESPYQNIPATS
jgi:hypothetical protein